MEAITPQDHFAKERVTGGQQKEDDKMTTKVQTQHRPTFKVTRADGRLIAECAVCGFPQAEVKRTRNRRAAIFCPECKTQLVSHSEKADELIFSAIQDGKGA